MHNIVWKLFLLKVERKQSLLKMATLLFMPEFVADLKSSNYCLPWQFIKTGNMRSWFKAHQPNYEYLSNYSQVTLQIHIYFKCLSQFKLFVP